MAIMHRLSLGVRKSLENIALSQFSTGCRNTQEALGLADLICLLLADCEYGKGRHQRGNQVCKESIRSVVRDHAIKLQQLFFMVAEHTVLSSRHCVRVSVRFLLVFDICTEGRGLEMAPFSCAKHKL